MAISRQDLPLIREAIDALYRVLEKPDANLPPLSVPNQWEPRPLYSDLPDPAAGNWSPPRWWEAFCTGVVGLKPGVRIDPAARPSPQWVQHAVIELLLARLMPSGVRREQECPDITSSDLDFSHRAALLGIRNFLCTSLGPHKLMKQPGSALLFRKQLADVLEVLGDGSQPPTEAIPNADPDEPQEAAPPQKEPKLTDRQKLILTEMLDMRAVGNTKKTIRNEVVKRIAKKKTVADFARDFGALKEGSYTDSLPGPGGGVWLTGKGKTKAEELNKENEQ